MDKKQQYTNRLIHEKSPYLLQHAHNPVDWYPWGEEAFSAAKVEDKPIFLSIGYATCHWCHRMEKESFEKLEIAKLMNEAFINIKVDREELPEIDSLYMEFAQSMMSGAAGWPLNLILTPNLQPFFASTYLPAYSSQGMVGMVDMIQRMVEIWRSEEREKVMDQAEKIVEIFKETSRSIGEDLPKKEQLNQGMELFYQMADPIFGGVKGSPKFPIGYQNNLLIRQSLLTGDGRALFLVERTLDMMHRGGIYDHLRGGFSRYSIDEEWLVPHFEKMLYDNALLIYSYLEVWKITRKSVYREICQEIIQYILEEMTGKDGGFFSAQDSESEGKEGYYYTWSFQEIEQILGKEEAILFCDFFDILPIGNFDGRSILHTPYPVEEFAKQRGLEADYVKGILDRQRKQLLEERKKRPAPEKDDKILTSWNGLLIFSLIEAGAAFQESKYLEAAEKATKFIEKYLWKDEILYHRWREGETHFRGGLDDYSNLIRALISLFEAGLGTEYLHFAMHLAEILDEKFKAIDGAYFPTDGLDEHLLIRRPVFSDGSEPSGNALHTENLLRLYQLTFNEGYKKNAEDVLKAVKPYIDTYPLGYAYHLINLQRYYDQLAPTIVIALNQKQSFKEEIKREIFGTLIPHRAVIFRKENDENLFVLLPWVRDYAPKDNQTTLYVCHPGRCDEPVTDIKEMIDIIHKL